MIIYTDENISKNIAHALNIVQKGENLRNKTNLEILALEDAFHKGIKDEEWIPFAGKQEACAITKDINIKYRQHQFALTKDFGLGVFFLNVPGNYLGWDIFQLLVNRWKEIEKIALKEEKPFAFLIKPRSFEKIE